MTKKTTNKAIKDVLFGIMSDIEINYKNSPNKILEVWPEIIGKKLAPMTEVLSFKNKILFIKVKNSTLYSILSQHEKDRLLKVLQNKFSKDAIRNIIFKIG